MDGTLLPGTTGMLEIAKILKQVEILHDFENQYREKKLTPVQFAESIYLLWGSLEPETVKEAFIQAPKLANIEMVLEKIAQQGDVSCLITSAPDFFANHFYDYGFDYIYASQPFTLIDKQFTPERVLHAHDKPQIAKRLCSELNIPFTSAIAFGDSHSDSALFEELTHTVAVNGDQYIKDIARHHYQGVDLLEAFSLL